MFFRQAGANMRKWRVTAVCTMDRELTGLVPSLLYMYGLGIPQNNLMSQKRELFP